MSYTPEPEANLKLEMAAVLRLGLPAVGEQVLTMMVNLVNTMLVGYLGATALAGVGLAGSISFLASTFFTAVATGATTLIAHAIGAQKPSLANKILGQSFIVSLILGIFSTLLLFPLAQPSMVLMGAEPEAVTLGTGYLRWISLSLPFLSILLVGGGALRGAGDTRSPMFIMGGVNAINLVLSIVLVRGMGPIPSLGVNGAGIAASISTVLGCAAVLLLLASGRSFLHLRRMPLHLDKAILSSLVRIGLPAGGETLLFRIAFLAYTRAISSLGTVAYAAYIITQRLEGFFDMPASGFGIAATTLVGQALGARQPARGKRAIFYAAYATLMFSFIFGLLCWFLPIPLMRLFTADPAVLAQGLGLMRVIALGMPTVAFALTFAGGLRGAGNTRIVMLTTGLGSWVVRVPLSILCVTLLPFGLVGVQITMFLDYGLRAFLLLFRLRDKVWRRHSTAIIS
ncbi:MAG: MATE family efflux transporter [Anaerolineae bacterium]